MPLRDPEKEHFAMLARMRDPPSVFDFKCGVCWKRTDHLYRENGKLVCKDCRRK